MSLATYQGMVGQEIGVSSWHVVDQNRINVYADVIEDHQFIHVDPDRAKKETAFGTTIAHGFLTMSLMSIMSYEVMPVIEGTTMGVNYGFDKLRFISPVRAGARARAVRAGGGEAAQADGTARRAPMSRWRSRARTSPRSSPTGSDWFISLEPGPSGPGLTRQAILGQKRLYALTLSPCGRGWTRCLGIADG